MKVAGKVWLCTGTALKTSASTVKSSIRTSTPPASRMMMSKFSSYQLSPSGVATIGLGSTSSSRRPRSGAADSLGMTEHPMKISTLMCTDNSNDRAAAVAALIFVIMPEVREADLRGDGAPFFLEIGTRMVRQADAARIEIDVQHLACPGRRHHVGGRHRLPRHHRHAFWDDKARIENQSVDACRIAEGRHGRDARLGRASCPTLAQILGDHHSSIESADERTSVRGGRPAGEAIARGRGAVLHLIRRELRHQIAIQRHLFTAENEDGRDDDRMHGFITLAHVPGNT